MSQCHRARSRIARAFEGGLSLERELELEEHARTCARCSRELASARRLSDALHALPSPPVERLDVERALEGIHTALDARPAAARPRWVAAGVAAACAVAAGLAIGALRGVRDEPSIGGAEVRPLELVTAEPAAEPAEERDELAPWSTDYDAARHADARAQVREHLREASAPWARQAEGPQARPFVAALEERWSDLVRGGWPVRSLVLGLLDDEDPVVARAAARYVGLRGDALGVRKLRQALGRAESKHAALAALADAGVPGMQGLAQAYWDPELSDRVSAAIETLGRERAIAWIESTLVQRARGAGDDDRQLARRLLALLPSHGAEGARAILRVAEHALLERGDVVEALARCDGAREVLLAAIGSARDDRSAALHLEAVERMGAIEALDWVVRQCRTRALGPRAARVLATLGGVEPLVALLDLQGSRYVGEDATVTAWRAALGGGEARLMALARRLARTQDVYRGGRLLEALVGTESAQAVGPMLELTASGLLSRADRERGVLAAGELATIEEAPALVAFFERLGPGEEQLGAACLYSLFRVGGAEVVEGALAEVGGSTRERALDLLRRSEGARGPALALFQLGRILQSALAGRSSQPEESS